MRWRSVLFAAPLSLWPRAEAIVTTALRSSLVLLSAPAAWAKVVISQDQALKNAFPSPIEVRRRTLFLTSDQALQIETLARAPVESHLVTYYEGWRGGRLVATAYFDTQVVRTMPMTYMALITTQGTLDSVEVISFYEPEDYLPRDGWLRLFRGKPLDETLRLRRGIPNVTGSSLTCQTITTGVRRLLATHQVAGRGTR